MIELRHICAGYGGEDVLRDVSLCCPSGAVTALCGPNGCGKSTLLRAAARLLEHCRGQVIVCGEDTAALSRRELAQKIAWLSQSRNVPQLTAGSLVLHGRFPYLGYPRRYSARDKQIARGAMERIGCVELWDAQLAELSGGQRQKVYLAMALAQDSPVLLLDEPTAYLDISHQLELMELVAALAREGRTVVMVLHDLNLALRKAGQIAVMQGGQVTACGAPGEIYESGVLERVFQVGVARTGEGGGQYLFTRKL